MADPAVILCLGYLVALVVLLFIVLSRADAEGWAEDSIMCPRCLGSGRMLSPDASPMDRAFARQRGGRDPFGRAVDVECSVCGGSGCVGGFHGAR